MSYDPYGNVLSGIGEDDFQYKGEQFDPNTNLTYMRARYYDPGIGRFISRDPIEGDLMNPQTQNGYNFANGDSINLSDPSGKAVYGACINVDLGLGAYGTCSGCAVYSTTEKKFSVLGSAGGGGTTGLAASFGVGGLYSSTNKISNLTGQDVFGGFSAGEGVEIGAGVSASVNDLSSRTYTGGIGIGVNATLPALPFEFHGGSTYTFGL